MSLSSLKASKVKEALFCYFPVQVALRTLPLAQSAVPILKMAYLHNRTQHENIQNDFAINGSEKRLEMIFDLIE